MRTDVSAEGHASFMSTRMKPAILLAALLFLPGYVFANAGVPILATTMTGIVLWLIPVVILEILILRKLTGMTAGAAAWPVVVANIASTLAGIGLTMVEIFFDLPTMMVVNPGTTSSYFLSLAFVVLFFFLSLAIELPVVRKMVKSIDRDVLKRAVIFANVGSYVMMSAFLIARMIKIGIS